MFIEHRIAPHKNNNLSKVLILWDHIPIGKYRVTQYFLSSRTFMYEKELLHTQKAKTKYIANSRHFGSHVI